MIFNHLTRVALCFLIGHDWRWTEGVVIPFLRCHTCASEKPIGYGMRSQDFR